MEIVGVDGKKLSAKDFIKKFTTYKVGDLEFKSEDKPEDILMQALQMAQQSIQMQVFHAHKHNNASDEDAKIKAMTAASSCQNPWQLEPCAWALFMMLAQQINEKDQLIEQLATRLEKLDGQKMEEVNPLPVEEKK